MSMPGPRLLPAMIAAYVVKREAMIRQIIQKKMLPLCDGLVSVLWSSHFTPDDS
jgi:hypothetical protein